MLYYDISYSNRKYKGVMNELNFNTYPYTKFQYKKFGVLKLKSQDENYKKFLEMENTYFEEVFDLNLCEKSTFEKFLKYYHIFKNEFNIPCEMAAYNTTPVENVFGYEVKFLGFDIVHILDNIAIVDSLLEFEDELEPKTRLLLNENGLCRTIKDIDQILPIEFTGGLKWEPCYVYKIIVE